VGSDIVVYNDANPFDETAMANPGNVTMVTNLVSFSSSRPRASGTVVQLDYGHDTVCSVYCVPASPNYATLYSTIEAAGLTVQDTASTAGSLLSFATNVKVLVLWVPREAYTAAEVNAMKAFAAEGGRVVFIGEYAGVYGASGLAVQNDLLANLGSGIVNTAVDVNCGDYFSVSGPSLAPHSVTAGVDSLIMGCSSVVDLGPLDAPIFYDTSGTNLLAASSVIDTTPTPTLIDGPHPEVTATTDGENFSGTAE
jgi:hypothetical protein